MPACRHINSGTHTNISCNIIQLVGVNSMHSQGHMTVQGLVKTIWSTLWKIWIFVLQLDCKTPLHDQSVLQHVSIRSDAAQQGLPPRRSWRRYDQEILIFHVSITDMAPWCETTAVTNLHPYSKIVCQKMSSKTDLCSPQDTLRIETCPCTEPSPSQTSLLKFQGHPRNLSNHSPSASCQRLSSRSSILKWEARLNPPQQLDPAPTHKIEWFRIFVFPVWVVSLYARSYMRRDSGVACWIFSDMM